VRNCNYANKKLQFLQSTFDEIEFNRQVIYCIGKDRYVQYIVQGI